MSASMSPSSKYSLSVVARGLLPPAPFTLSLIHILLDVIYNPFRTALLQQAEARGLPAVNGMLMPVSYTHLDVYKRQHGYSP